MDEVSVVDLMADLLRSYEALTIPIDECAIEEFMHINDENNQMFLQEVLDDVNDVLGWSTKQFHPRSWM